MQLQPERDDDDCRTIFLLKNNKVVHETLTKRLSDWTWRTINELKNQIPGAIGFIKREISGTLQHKRSNQGSAASTKITTAELREGLLSHVGIDPTTIKQGLFKQIPKTVVKSLEEKIRNNVLSAKMQWNQKGEIQLTGQAFGYIAPFRVGDYEIKLASVEFSSIAKEPDAGADVALLLHTQDIQGHTEVKTIWFQAKRADTEDQSLLDMPKLAEQMTQMRSINIESFPLVFRPSGVVVYKKMESTTPIGLADFLGRAAQCEFGNTSLDVFVDSLDKNSIFEIAIKKIPRIRKKSVNTAANPNKTVRATGARKTTRRKTK